VFVIVNHALMASVILEVDADIIRPMKGFGRKTAYKML
jgi:hypothetical protein